MTAPRWFYMVIACCALVLTGATALHLRYAPTQFRPIFLDTWTRRLVRFPVPLTFPDSIAHVPPVLP